MPEQSFTAYMLLLTATIAFGLRSNARVLLTGVTCAISVDSKFIQYSSAETQTGNNLLLLLSDLIDWQCVIIWRLIGTLFYRCPRIIGKGTCTTKQTASVHTDFVNQPLLEQIPQHRIFGKTQAGFYRLNAPPGKPFDIVLPLASFCLNSFSRVTHAADNFGDNLSRIIFTPRMPFLSPNLHSQSIEGNLYCSRQWEKFTHTCWTSSLSGRPRLLRDPTHQTLYAGSSMSVQLQFSIILTWQRDGFYQPWNDYSWLTDSEIY